MASLNDELNRTIALLQQDLSVVSLEDALAILESWISQLQGLEIANDLGELKDALRKQKSPDAIANLLIELGGDTTSELLIETSEETATKVRQLADLLTQAGRSLRE